MQRERKESERETEVLKRLLDLEDLAEKKTKIYARFLMDVALAKEMEELSLRHQQRKDTLYTLLYGKDKKMAKGKNGIGMVASNEEMENL